MILRVGVVWPDRLDLWPDRSGQAPCLSGRPDRPPGWPSATLLMTKHAAVLGTRGTGYFAQKLVRSPISYHHQTANQTVHTKKKKTAAFDARMRHGYSRCSFLQPVSGTPVCLYLYVASDEFAGVSFNRSNQIILLEVLITCTSNPVSRNCLSPNNFTLATPD